MDLAVIAQTHHIGGHLGISGIGALSDLRLAALHGDAAVQIQQHPVGGRFQRDGVDGGVIPEGGHADAVADGAGLLGELRLFAVVVDVLLTNLQTLAEGILIVDVVGEAVLEALGHEVLHPEGQRVHAHGLGALVHVGLVGKGGLRHSVATHGSGGGAVGEHRPRIALHVVTGIVLGEGTHGLGHDAVAVGGIGSLIGVELHLPGGEGAVLAEPRDDVESDGVAHTVGDEGLLTGAVHPDAATVDLRGAPGAQGLIEGILLIAEAAADVGLHHPDIAPRATQRLSHHTADDMGDLCGGHHRDAAVLLIGEAAVVLDVAVLHRGRLVPALHLDEARLPNGSLIVALLHIGVLEDVVGVGLVELGSAGLHGLLHIQHEGQLLVFHLQRPDALHGGHLVFCNDHRHVVAVVADVPVQQVAVRHILMAGVHGPGVARRGERVLRHVETGQYLHHAGDLLRRRGVHRLDEAVGDGGVLDADIQCITGHEVLVVFGAAGGLIKGVYPHLGFSYFSHVVFLLMSASLR